MILSKYIFPFCAAILITITCHAQSNIDYSKNEILHFSVADGMTSNDIISITQDNYGFIWIGTAFGADCYQGFNFRSFRYGNGSQCISHNYAQDLLKDKDGNIWIATSNGLNRYMIQSDSIVVNMQKNAKGKLSSNDIVHFAKDIFNKGIWIATYNKGVDFYDYQTQSFKPLVLPKSIKFKNLISILEDSQMNLWLGTLQDGLYRYSLKNKNWEHFNTPRVDQITNDSKGNIWFAADRIFVYNLQTKKFRSISFSNRNYWRCSRVFADNDGRLWIGCFDLLGYLDISTFKFDKEPFINEIKLKGNDWGKSFSIVDALFVDRNKNIWVGTYGDGLYMIRGKEDQFTLLSHNWSNMQQLSSNNVTCAVRDHFGNLFVGLSNSGIDVLDSNLNFKYNINSKNGLACDNILGLYNDSHNNLWIISRWEGIDLKLAGSSSFKHLSTANGLPSNLINCVKESSDGRIYIATEEGLCYLQRGKINTDLIHSTQNRYDIRSIDFEGDNIWAGTYGDGIICYNKKSHKIKSYLTEDINTKYIYKIIIRGEYIYLSTRGNGLLLFSIPQKRVIKRLDPNTNNSFFPTFELDNKNDILAASEKGIIYLKNNKATLFNMKSGIQENQFKDSYVYKEKDGSLTFYFSGYNGLNILSSKKLDEKATDIPVYFTGLKINEQEVRPGEAFDGSIKNNPLNDNMMLTRNIELSYNQSNFSIEFSSPVYEQKEAFGYLYYLEGIDNHWIEVGKEPEIKFRNLAPGHYVLKVKERNSSKCAELNITIKPPFWNTEWAHFIYFILFVCALYIAWFISTIRMRANHKLKLEKTERQKEEEIYKARLQFFTNISHELRTPLALIISPLESMDQKKYPDISNSLDLITRNARKLMQLINQLLDFRKAEMGRMKLKVRYGNLSQHLQNISASFEGLRTERHITMTFSSTPMSVSGYFDSDFIEKILFNLLSNAYKFTNDEGTISILLRQEVINNKLNATIKVTDNGCGIPQKDIQNIFKRFYQSENINPEKPGTGIGLHLVKDLADLHHGSIRAENNEDRGATFTLTIPIEEGSYSDQELEMPRNSKEESEERQQEENLKKNQNSNNTICILVVDDEPDMCEYIKGLLRPKYKVLIANNGKEALYILKQEECHIVVSDVMMPEMDGYKLCDKIKTNIDTSHIPVILLTAKADFESKMEGLKTGADSYIAKPFHPQHLLVRIEKLIESRYLFKQRFSQEQNFNTIHIENNPLDETLLKNIIDFINKNLTDAELNGDKIAKGVNISRMTLHRKLKSLVGYSSSELIRIIRLKEAAYQIEHTEDNISDICYKVGFNSPSYFTSCFTKHYNLTPTEYLKNKRK
jgi:signal transduction histidine kinase/DNA-binding response OmpR family regulator/ligand-binding sensor domain-containing protein